MKKYKSILCYCIALIGLIGVNFSIFAAFYTSSHADKLAILEHAIKTNTLKQLGETRGDFQFAMGNLHTGVIINGQIYMWGRNVNGQLGIGKNENKNVPTRVDTISGKATKLALGYTHSAAVIDGRLYTWGYNGYGELGLGHTTDKNVPTLVESITGKIDEISLGYGFSGAIVDSKLFMWGWNQSKKLGIASDLNQTTPQHVSFFNNPVSNLSLGARHAGVVHNQQLYAWGDNRSNQLARAEKNDNMSPALVEFYDKSIIFGKITLVIFSGINSAMVMDGKMFTWGDNNWRQLGYNSNYNGLAAQVVVPADAVGAVTHAGINGYSGGVIINAKCYTWGSPEPWTAEPMLKEGIVGSVYKILFSPKAENEDSLLPSVGAQQIVVTNQAVFCWGNNEYDQLGLGEPVGHPKNPMPMNTIVAFDSTNIITLDANNDKNNLRTKLANNIDTPDMIALINEFIATSMVINLPFDAAIQITNPSYIVSRNVDGKPQGQVEFDFTYNKSYVNGAIKDATTAFSGIKIHGFTPANLTETQHINAKMPIDNPFKGKEINELVNENKENNLLTNWMIANSTIILGQIDTHNTVNFPRGAKITNITNIEILDGTTGTIGFTMEVDKFYKLGIDGDLIESSPGEKLTLNNKVKITNFKATPSSTLVQNNNHSENMTASEFLSQILYYVSDDTPLSVNSINNIKNYITFDQFPADTKFYIRNVVIENGTLTFKIHASKYYDELGILNDNKSFGNIRFFDFLIPPVPPVPPIEIPWLLIFGPLSGLLLLILLACWIWLNLRKQKTYTVQYVNTIYNADQLTWNKINQIKNIDIKNLYNDAMHYDIDLAQINSNKAQHVKVNNLDFSLNSNANKVKRLKISVRRCIIPDQKDFIYYLVTRSQLIHLGYIQTNSHANKLIPKNILNNINAKIRAKSLSKLPMLKMNIFDALLPINVPSQTNHIKVSLDYSSLNENNATYADTKVLFNKTSINIDTIANIDDIKVTPVNAITDAQIDCIIKQLLPSLVSSYPPQTNIAKTNIFRVTSVTKNKTNVGQVMFDLTLDLAYENGIIISKPFTIPNIAIYGFVPINASRDIKISAIIPANDSMFDHMSMFELVSNVNRTTSNNNMLRKWILNNQQLFIGDTSHGGCINFPRGSKIVKVDEFQINSNQPYTISFYIAVDKYYKHIRDTIIESSPTDAPLTLYYKANLIGFEQPVDVNIENATDWWFSVKANSWRAHIWNIKTCWWCNNIINQKSA